jgi:hypothetical protein
MKRLLLIFLIFLFHITSGQELNCKVTVNASQLGVNTAGDKEVFIQMEQSIQNFMNTQRWTNDIYAEKEKIKCSLNINLLKAKQYSYSGNAQFQVTRPVFGSTYETVLFQYIDRSFDFSFTPEDRTMLFNEQAFTNNLTSTLAYYSLIALTLDYDSFSKFGGNPFIERAFNIASLAGNTVKGVWTQETDPRNRYYIIENLRNQQLNPYREGFYTYHRMILDDFANNPAQQRKNVLAYLNTLKTISTLKPNAVMIRNFFDSKAPELIQIFSESEKPEKQEAFKILTQIDPTKAETYRQILK